MIGVAALLSAATFVRFYLMMTLGERVVTDLRRTVFNHILALEPGYFEATRTGEVISRLTNDTTLLQQVIGYGLSMFVRNLLMMLGAAVMMFVVSWKLAAFVLLGIPATLVPILLLGRRVRRLSRDNQDRVADVSAYVDEAVHEIRTVQAYAHEGADREAFGRHAEAAYRSGVSRIGQKAFLIASVMLIAFCAVGVILWVGGHDVFAGRLSAGELSAFVFYAFVVATGAGTVSEVWGELQRAAGATERLMEILDTRPAIAAPAAAGAAPAAHRDRLRQRDVRLSGAARARRRSTASRWQVSQGERVALVGPSGAGKTTVLSLLLRFYDPQSGALRIGGTDLREFDPAALRRLIAVVPQDPVIFAASVLDNVRYGRPEASREEAERACEQAFALEFIHRLPQGLDTRARRARRHALGRPAPAPVDRARAARRPADPAARRGDQLARCGERAHGAAGAGGARARPHHRW